MAIKTERLQLRVDIDTAEGVRNLTALQEKYDLLIQKNKEAKGDDKASIAKEALAAKEALEKERESLGLVGLTLKELKQLQRELNSEKNRYNEGTDQYNKANANLNTVKTRIKELSSAQYSYNQELLQTVKTQGVEALSLTHLREYYKLLKKEIEETADFESEANKKRIADSQNIAQLISKKEGDISGSTSFFSQIKQQLPSAVAGASGGMFVGVATELSSTLIGAVSSAFDVIKKRARDITDIQVSLDTSRGNAEKIKGELNDIRTESSVDELKKLVQVAGDLNVATGDVKAFVTQADQFAVVMGDDFGTNIEESVALVAKLKAEFKDTRDLNFQDSLGKVGSMLKDLNLDGAATVPGMTDFLKRVGALPDKLKPAITDLAALGAVFEEANLTSEIAGSGYSKILLTASNNAELFGKQMRMSKKEVENLINTNPNEFVIKFTESLKGLSGTDTAKTLKAVKLESDEVTKVVGVLTDNVDKLRQKQELANQSFTDGTTITSTFNKYLNDEAGQIGQIEKAWSRVTNGFVNWLTKISGPVILSLADMAEKGQSASEVFEEQEKKTTAMNAMLPKLVDKYEMLSLKTEKTAEDQERLNDAMQKIVNIVPGAVSQYGDLGRVMRINLGFVNDFIEKNNILFKQNQVAAINEKNKMNNNLGGQRKEILEELRKGEVVYLKDRRNSVYESRKLTDDEIRDRQRQLTEINKTILANKKRVAQYKGEEENEFAPIPTDTKTDTKKPNISTGTGKGKGKGKGSGDADARAKYLQDSAKQMLELQAKLDFEELQATADAEQKRINIANKTAEDEIKRIETQFKNQKGIILKESQLSQEQKDIIHRERLQIERKQEEEVNAINTEFSEKRKAQILEQTNRAIQLAQDAKSKQLQATLKTAQRKGTSQEIFNAQEAILFNNQQVSLANLKVRYDKEKEALKDNKDALEQLEKNYGTEKSNIISNQIADWEALISEFYKNDIERKKKANIEKLQLDVSEAELNGQDPTEAKIALLNAQMIAELAITGRTEEEKNNIIRGFSIERESFEKERRRKNFEDIINFYQQAFSGITDIARTELANRETAENEKYNSQKQRVEDLENAGTYSKAKAKFEQTKIEKAHNRELSKIRYEQAKLDKAANISQATINGIQAVMKAYAQTGILGGPVAAAIIGGITAVQIGQMIAQPLPKIEGSFFKGGAMPNQFQKPLDEKGGGLILAHPDEFMIPKWIRQDPIFADIEPVVQHMIDTGRSYYNGGPVLETSKPSTISTRPNQDITPILNKLASFLEQNISMQEEIITGVRNIQINVGYEAAEKILDAGNQLKSIKDSAKA